MIHLQRVELVLLSLSQKIVTSHIRNQHEKDTFLSTLPYAYFFVLNFLLLSLYIF